MPAIHWPALCSSKVNPVRTSCTAHLRQPSVESLQGGERQLSCSCRCQPAPSQFQSQVSAAVWSTTKHFDWCRFLLGLDCVSLAARGGELIITCSETFFCLIDRVLHETLQLQLPVLVQVQWVVRLIERYKGISGVTRVTLWLARFLFYLHARPTIERAGYHVATGWYLRHYLQVSHAALRDLA